jgi:phenylacetate-CoA ligase
MKIGYRQRLADFAGGLRLSRELARRERQPREGLHLYQQKRLESVVRHAAGHSPFYRERLAGVVGQGPVELSRLPTLNKSEMMEHFDELVTDGRLRRDSLLGWVEGLDREELYLDRYRVMTTSGSSGHKGLFVFDRPEWRTVIGMFLRYSRADCG